MRLRYDNVESITWDIQKGTVAQAQSLSFKIKLDSRKAQVGTVLWLEFSQPLLFYRNPLDYPCFSITPLPPYGTIFISVRARNPVLEALIGA
jgi:hypothetical protein